MTRPFAANTTVPVERTKTELDKLLSKHNATSRMTGSDDEGGFAYCAFAIGGRQVRLKIPVPLASDFVPKEDGELPRGWLGWSHTQKGEWCEKQAQQMARERWRALLLVVKSKLEMIAIGLSSVEREFLADVMLPGGKTVYERISESVEDAYKTGKVSKLLGA